MSGIWYATALAATTGALFSIASEIGPLAPQKPSASSSSTSVQSSANPVRARALTNTTATEHTAYTEAIELANQAVVAYQNAQQTDEPSKRINFTRQERDHWQASLTKLSHIPKSSTSYPQAVEKQAQYQVLLATAEGKLAAHDNALLTTIAGSTSVRPEQVHISLCQIDTPPAIPPTAIPSTPPSTTEPNTNGLNTSSCRHHQGDAHLASAASLIKLPIAIALMDKLEQENKSLSDKLYIDPNNFTENAEGIGIEVDQEYTLAQVVTRMINESNNIATNQLIDYIGRENMAKTMTSRGYTRTLIDFKLAGDRILPPNPGTQSNQLTSNDLTAMMVHIYGLENSGDEALLTALISQKDRELGHTALQDISPTVTWLGEKTGQNDRLIGSTLAMKVGNHRYALTVAIDHSGDVHALRSIIRAVTNHLVKTGPIAGNHKNE